MKPSPLKNKKQIFKEEENKSANFNTNFKYNIQKKTNSTQ